MEENVALNRKKQKKFIKSLTGIKKLLKKKADEPKPEEVVEEKVKKEDVKKKIVKSKDGKVIKKKWVKPKGLVYLSHIPHGFYEHQMTQYFRQFGVVTNARVIRSKRTGNSKGCAFVEFREPAVAEIVAETMNNYLMGKRLIKAFVVPHRKQRKNALRKLWTSNNNPSNDVRMAAKRKHNEDKDEEGELKRARKLLSNLNKTKKKLSELGIHYDFSPVDIPEALIKKEKVVNEVQVKKEHGKVKKEKKNVVPVKKEVTEKVDVKNVVKASKASEAGKKAKVEQTQNKKNQKEKEKSLKKAGVKPPEDFITVQQEGDDSDSSYDFDSDEYEKMLENDDDNSNASDDEDEAEIDDDSEEISDKEEEVIPSVIKNKKNVNKKQPVSLQNTAKNPKQKAKKPQLKEVKKPAPQQPINKRKTQQNVEVTSKKPKFEKSSQKKKQFKKKKVVS